MTNDIKDCKTCAYTLVCLAGHFPENWQPLWKCADCGVISWGEVPMHGPVRPKLLARCSIREVRFSAKRESVCRKCYWKRELAEDEAHEERLRKGEVEPRMRGYGDWTL